MTEEDRVIEELTPEEKRERWQQRPRPMDFIRPRLYLDTAEYLRTLLTREQEALFDDLAKLRAAGKSESNPDVQQCRDDLTAINTLLKETNKALYDLIGPRPEQ